MKSMRPRTRKSVTELYGGAVNKNQIHTGNLTAKTQRNAGGDMGAFLISSNTPYHNASAVPTTNTTSRRKQTARHSVAKDDKHMEEIQKKDQSSRMRTSRTAEKRGCLDPALMYENHYLNFSEGSPCDKQHALHMQQMQHLQMPPPQTRRQVSPESDKDDDTEEFFELIRQTVEGAIGKAMNEILNRNFRELSNKVDRFSAELKATNAMLGKMQCEINNKVVHYGEENSRHFRYLCMKSEYDKMFYQHNSMMSSNVQPPKPPTGCAPSKRASKTRGNVGEASTKAPCTCRSSNKKSEQDNVGSEGLINVSKKSSEVGVREVLEHIQRFCNNMQMNEMKNEERQMSNRDEALQMNKDIFENDEDDEDFPLSSDGMTPRSDENSVPMRKYSGSITKRGLSAARGGNGGGDA